MDDHRHFGYITIYVIKKETMSIYYAIQTYLFPSLISSFLSHQHGHEKAHFWDLPQTIGNHMGTYEEKKKKKEGIESVNLMWSKS